MSAAPRQVPRCLGAVTGGAVGPTVVVIGGIHGNEPAGVLAAHLVLGELRARSAKLRGKAIALSGNRLALQHGLRFLDRDLNRNWDPADLERLAARPCHA